MQKKLKTRTAIILGGSKGIGREISKGLNRICKKVHALSSKDIDTSDLDSVEKFCKKFKKTDIIVLNSGGPPNIEFNKITTEHWKKYFNQLFLGYAIILKNIKVAKNGYIFYISSSIIKEPSQNLIISSALRIAFSSLLKSLSFEYSKNNISIINIAPGPFKTDRAKNLIKNLRLFEKNLPKKKIGNPKEIGDFVSAIVDKKITYISGSIVYFDGNISKSFV